MKSPPLSFLSPFARVLFSALLILVISLLVFFLAIVIALPVFGYSLSGILSMISDFSNPDAIPVLKFFQVAQEVGMFILPPVVAALFFAAKPAAFLSIDAFPRWQVWMITLLIMVTTLPGIHQLIEWNEAMTLPGWLKSVETWMQMTENQARELTNAFLNVTTMGGFMFNILMMALLPAIGEELLFRGLFQRLFHDLFRNIHVAILFTAFLFGAMHLQFYGILPRMVFGILFGYLLWWSQSLWIPIGAHFFNNVVAVTVSFLEKHGHSLQPLEAFESSGSPWVIVGSLVVFSLMVYLFRHFTRSGKRGVPGFLSRREWDSNP